jgi:hypothetical protein
MVEDKAVSFKVDLWVRFVVQVLHLVGCELLHVHLLKLALTLTLHL